MPDSPRTCPSCGAHVPADSDQCDLCGTAVSPAPEDADSSDDGAEEGGGDANSESQDSEPEPEEGPSVFCNQCGWENPPGARYCSQCGAELQDLSDASPAGTRPVTADLPQGTEEDTTTDAEPAAEPDEQAAMGRQIALVVGGALALVLVLFFATQWSAQYEWGGGESSSDTPSAQATPSGGGAASSGESSGRPRSTRGTEGQVTDLRTLVDQTASPPSGAMAGRIDSLRTRIDQASGQEIQRLRTKLTNLLIGAGQPGRAALVQKKIAETTGTVEARRRTADLLYRWMQKLQNRGQRKQISQVARHAAQAYKAVTEERPDDLDARTRMGEAYLLTNNPMRGIKAINAVLDDDSTFVPARFQKGLALLQINRVKQAKQQFRKAKQYADKESPFYQQATRALKVIKKRQAKSSGGRSPEQSANPPS
ncbi:MAG: zinc-ribbon domain-containing protein [Salinibacter sp.]|uniref:zinc-ribbon domain-containing protein n=1 Tax=Salinibacter sp. TaxID=2065818 RepID=UPI0035D4708D